MAKSAIDAAATPGASSGARFEAPPRSRRRTKVDVSLRFLHEILGLEHLHYGLWDLEAGTPPDRAGLEAAQQRYLEHLLAWIPDGVSSVLDVGAGTGATSRALLERGYEIEGLSPDPFQAELYASKVGRPFHLGRFQEFVPARSYDLVLMSESAQYVWLASLFPAVCRVAPGGWLLVSDYFTVADDGGPLSKSGHPLDAFLRAAQEHGLSLEAEEDITERVLPTLDLGRAWVERYVVPSLDLLAFAARRRYPRLFGLGRLLAGRKVRAALANRALLDSEAFARVKRYRTMRFKVPATAPASITKG